MLTIPPERIGLHGGCTVARGSTRQPDALLGRDPLTGLHARQSFALAVERARSNTARGGRVDALICLDIDRFRCINAAIGEYSGNVLLRRLSSLLQQHVRSEDVLGRLGADAFAILVPMVDPGELATLGRAYRELAGRVRYPWGSQSCALSASVGVVAIGSDMHSAEWLIASVELATRHAQGPGGSGIHVHGSATGEAHEACGDIDWIGRLRDGLAEDRFALAFQPIEPTASAARRNGIVPCTRTVPPGAPVEARSEALIRLPATAGAPIDAKMFLPAAERFGLMPAIDRWVVESAIRHLSECDAGQRTVLNVNLSTASLAHRGLADDIESMLRARHISGRWLTFEITETAALQDLAAAQCFMRQLARHGCTFALDDFGSGHCSFPYLRELDAQWVKIDGSFVRRMHESPVDRRIVQSINEIAHLAGKRTVAESVETCAALEILLEFGVDCVQGMMVAPAVTPTRDRPQPAASRPLPEAGEAAQ